MKSSMVSMTTVCSVSMSFLAPAADLFDSATLGDPETVERLTRLNGRFATVEDAKKEKGDKWSGYRYVL